MSTARLPGVIFAALAIAGCTAAPAEDGSAAPAGRLGDAWFEVLLAEHCLRVDRSIEPAEVKRLQQRLADLRRRAVADGMAGEGQAAEQRWTDFAARAEFICEPGSADRMNKQIDRLIMSIQSGK